MVHVWSTLRVALTDESEYLMMRASTEPYHLLNVARKCQTHALSLYLGFVSDVLDEYIAAVRRMTCRVLELVAQGLGLDDDGVFSRLVLDRDSDSMLRVNHYPPRPDESVRPRRLTGFGEHTDPQIISVLRSNDTAGLEISLRDGTWVSVPSDTQSFFVNVGDALQVRSMYSHIITLFFLLYNTTHK